MLSCYYAEISPLSFFLALSHYKPARFFKVLQNPKKGNVDRLNGQRLNVDKMVLNVVKYVDKMVITNI